MSNANEPVIMRGKIAYSYDGKLHILNLATEDVQVYDAVRLMTTPAWRSTGSHIAFGRHDVYVLDTTTDNIRQLTQSKWYEGNPSWSPDGRFLVYNRTTGPNAGLFITEVETGTTGMIPVESEKAPFQPAWSPDGQKIAMVIPSGEDYHIFTIDTDCLSTPTCVPEQITNSHSNQSPAWSPDGEQLAYARKDSGRWSIYVMNADGTDPIKLTDHPDGDTDPTWSPDGNFIAFERREGANFYIYTMRSDGSDVQHLTRHGGREPAWWAEVDD